MTDAPAEQSGAPAGSASVLVVIQDADVRARTVSALGLRRDLDVQVVSEIAEARDAVAGADVLVVDGDLQPKGGYSWLYELRESAELAGEQRPPSLVLTDRPDDQFLVEWSSAEAWLEKPVDPFKLAKAVAELAAGRAVA